MFFRRAGNALASLAAAGEQGVSSWGAEGQGFARALSPNNMFMLKCLSNCGFSSSVTPLING